MSSTAPRRARLAGLATGTLAVAAVMTGCGEDGSCATLAATGCTGPDRAPTSSSTGDASCVGTPGEESILQGQPHDLPGGAGVGIGSIDMAADPPTVRLVLANVPNAQRDQENTLAVDESIQIGERGYAVTQICPDKVSLSPSP